MTIIKKFNKKSLNESDYTFIISNMILSQEKDFTYDDVLKKFYKVLQISKSNKIDNLVKKILVRLREDGFISSLGSFFTVEKISL